MRIPLAKRFAARCQRKWHGHQATSLASDCIHDYMVENIVALPVPAEILINCRFWLDGDVWKGVADQFELVVNAPTFEDAKKEMQQQLRDYIQALLPNCSDTQASPAA